jgi:hypothetical protein
MVLRGPVLMVVRGSTISGIGRGGGGHCGGVSTLRVRGKAMITYTTTRLIKVQGGPGRIVTFKPYNMILNVLDSIKERKRRSRN